MQILFELRPLAGRGRLADASGQAVEVGILTGGGLAYPTDEAAITSDTQVVVTRAEAGDWWDVVITSGSIRTLLVGETRVAALMGAAGMLTCLPGTHACKAALAALRGPVRLALTDGSDPLTQTIISETELEVDDGRS